MILEKTFIFIHFPIFVQEYGGKMGPSGKSQIRRDNPPHNTHHLSQRKLDLFEDLFESF